MDFVRQIGEENGRVVVLAEINDPDIIAGLKMGSGKDDESR